MRFDGAPAVGARQQEAPRSTPAGIVGGPLRFRYEAVQRPEWFSPGVQPLPTDIDQLSLSFLNVDANMSHGRLPSSAALTAYCFRGTAYATTSRAGRPLDHIDALGVFQGQTGIPDILIGSPFGERIATPLWPRARHSGRETAT